MASFSCCCVSFVLVGALVHGLALLTDQFQKKSEMRKVKVFLFIYTSWGYRIVSFNSREKVVTSSSRSRRER